MKTVSRKPTPPQLVELRLQTMLHSLLFQAPPTSTQAPGETTSKPPKPLPQPLPLFTLDVKQTKHLFSAYVQRQKLLNLRNALAPDPRAEANVKQVGVRLVKQLTNKYTYNNGLEFCLDEKKRLLSLPLESEAELVCGELARQPPQPIPV